MVDNYHSDMGEGVTRIPPGRRAVWRQRRLGQQSTFRSGELCRFARVDEGPIRVMFELVYEPFDANGTQVSESVRVSLDAGSQLNHFQNYYRAATAPLAVAVGLKKVKDEQKEFNAERGWLTSWQAVDKNLGMQGLAIIVNSGDVDKQAEDARNNLLVMKPKSASPVSYWAGLTWDRAGVITSAESWKKYVDDFAERLRSRFK
jgi:pectinesterase